MNYLTLISIVVGMTVLSGCQEKSEGPSSETDSSGTTEPGSTSSSSGDTTGPEPTSGGDTAESTSVADETTGESDTSQTATGTTGEPLDEDCAFLVGKNFVSKKQFPCGPQPDDEPVELCPDHVSFEQDTFMYQSGDFGVSGTYTCEGGVIAGLVEEEKYAGTIDAASGELVWEDTEFVVE